MQTRESELLQMKLEAARQEMENRELKLREAGNLADAVLSINGVFESTQNAAQQYLDNVARMEQRTQECCLLIMEEADQILEEAEQILMRAKQICDGSLETTEQPALEVQLKALAKLTTKMVPKMEPEAEFQAELNVVPRAEPKAEPKTVPEEKPEPIPEEKTTEAAVKTVEKRKPLKELYEKASQKLTPSAKAPKKQNALGELLTKGPYKLTPLAEALAKVFR